jgi:hypothetical protein
MSTKMACVDDGTQMWKKKELILKLISSDENNSKFDFHHLKSNNYKIIYEKSHSSKVFQQY